MLKFHWYGRISSGNSDMQQYPARVVDKKGQMMEPSSDHPIGVGVYTLTPECEARPTACEICHKTLVTDTELRRASESRGLCDRCIHIGMVIACTETPKHWKIILAKDPIEEFEKPLACEYLSLREEIFGSGAIVLADGLCPKTRRYNQLLLYFHRDLPRPKDWLSPVAGNLYRREATVERWHGVYFAQSYDAANQDYASYTLAAEDQQRFNLRLGDGIIILYSKIIVNPRAEKRDTLPCTVERKLN